MWYEHLLLSFSSSLGKHIRQRQEGQRTSSKLAPKSPPQGADLLHRALLMHIREVCWAAAQVMEDNAGRGEWRRGCLWRVCWQSARVQLCDMLVQVVVELSVKLMEVCWQIQLLALISTCGRRHSQHDHPTFDHRALQGLHSSDPNLSP